MKAIKFALISSVLLVACGESVPQDAANPTLAADNSSPVQAEPGQSAGNAIQGTWDYVSLLPLNPDGSAGTDTTGLGMFHSSMIGTILNFTDTLCEMKGKMGNSAGSYVLSADLKSITLRRKGKEQVWSIKELNAETLTYSTGGMPIVVTYKRRH